MSNAWNPMAAEMSNYKGRQINVFISISSEYKISNVVLSEVTVYSKPKKDQYASSEFRHNYVPLWVLFRK